MKLYFAPDTCSLAPHIVLRELALPFTLVRVNNHSKKTEDGEDFYYINPKGYVAALEMDEGSILTEGPAILLYLASLQPSAPLCVAPGGMDYIRLLEWLNFLATELHAGMAPLFNRALPQQVREGFEQRLFQRFAYLEHTLRLGLFLQGETIGLADIYLYVLCGWGKFFAIDLAQWPNLQAHYQRIHARPAVQAALLAEQ